MEPFHLVVALLILADFMWGGQHKEPEQPKRPDKEERLEWCNNSDKQLDRFENAITRLADGIRDTKSRND